MKKIIALILAGVMLFALGGCGAADFDAKGYVEAVLDAKFHREYKEYAKIIGVSQKEAKEQMESEFNESLQTSMTDFKKQFGITDEEMAQYIKMEADVREKVQYEVKDAVKDEDGNFTVDVVITPVPAYTNLKTAFSKKLTEAVQNGATEEQYMGIFLETMKECIENVGEGKAVTVTLNVEWKENGKNKVYSVDEKDWSNLDLIATGSNVE